IRHVDPDRLQRSQITIDDVRRVRFENDLVLIIVLQPVRILAVAAVGRPARWLHVGRIPRLRAECAQRRRRMESPGPDREIVGLKDGAALRGPVRLELQDQVLEALARFGSHRLFFLRSESRRKLPRRPRKGQSPRCRGSYAPVLGLRSRSTTCPSPRRARTRSVAAEPPTALRRSSQRKPNQTTATMATRTASFAKLNPSTAGPPRGRSQAEPGPVRPLFDPRQSRAGQRSGNGFGIDPGATGRARQQPLPERLLPPDQPELNLVAVAASHGRPKVTEPIYQAQFERPTSGPELAGEELR